METLSKKNEWIWKILILNKDLALSSRELREINREANV